MFALAQSTFDASAVQVVYGTLGTDKQADIVCIGGGMAGEQRWATIGAGRRDEAVARCRIMMRPAYAPGIRLAYASGICTNGRTVRTHVTKPFLTPTLMNHSLSYARENRGI